MNFRIGLKVRLHIRGFEIDEDSVDDDQENGALAREVRDKHTHKQFNFRVLLWAETAAGLPGGRPAVGNSLQFPSRFPSQGARQTHKQFNCRVLLWAETAAGRPGAGRPGWGRRGRGEGGAAWMPQRLF